MFPGAGDLCHTQHVQTVSRTALELLLEDGGHPAAVASQGRLAALPEGGGSQQAAAAAAAEEAEGEPKSFEGLFAL